MILPPSSVLTLDPEVFPNSLTSLHNQILPHLFVLPVTPAAWNRIAMCFGLTLININLHIIKSYWCGFFISDADQKLHKHPAKLDDNIFKPNMKNENFLDGRFGIFLSLSLFINLYNNLLIPSISLSNFLLIIHKISAQFLLFQYRDSAGLHLSSSCDTCIFWVRTVQMYVNFSLTDCFPIYSSFLFYFLTVLLSIINSYKYVVFFRNIYIVSLAMS